MSYRYKTKTDAELAQIAARLLDQFAHRRSGLAVDIEAIIEDLGVEVLPRRGFRDIADGYLARDPAIIVVDESIYSYMPRARFTLAEEVCHLVLEYRLWKDGVLPVGARCHELSREQHLFVEKDARTLASFILMPAAEFKYSMESKLRELLELGLEERRAVEHACRYAGQVFDVSPRAAFFRAVKLRILDRHGGVC